MKKIGYMDKIDFYYELSEACGGNVVYPSIEDIKEYQPCCIECGIVKVEVKHIEDVSPSSNFKGKKWEEYEESLEYFNHLVDKIEKTEKLLAFYKRELENFNEKI